MDIDTKKLSFPSRNFMRQTVSRRLLSSKDSRGQARPLSRSGDALDDRRQRTHATLRMEPRRQPPSRLADVLPIHDGEGVECANHVFASFQISGGRARIRIGIPVGREDDLLLPDREWTSQSTSVCSAGGGLSGGAPASARATSKLKHCRAHSTPQGTLHPALCQRCQYTRAQVHRILLRHDDSTDVYANGEIRIGGKNVSSAKTKAPLERMVLSIPGTRVSPLSRSSPVSPGFSMDVGAPPAPTDSSHEIGSPQCRHFGISFRCWTASTKPDPIMAVGNAKNPMPRTATTAPASFPMIVTGYTSP